MSLSIRVPSDNGAVVALAGAADASMPEPSREPIRSAPADTKVLAALAEVGIHHVVAVHRTVSDALVRHPDR